MGSEETRWLVRKDLEGDWEVGRGREEGEPCSRGGEGGGGGLDGKGREERGRTD